MIEETSSPGPRHTAKARRDAGDRGSRRLDPFVSVAHGGSHLVRHGRPRGPDQRLAALAERSPALLPLRARHTSFLKDSWTTAGYDPYFMAGYAKSVVYPASSTLPELVVALFGGEHPEFAYKLYVLVSAAAVPWLIALACAVWRIPPAGTAIAVVLCLDLRLDRFPDQVRRVRDGALFSGAFPLGWPRPALFARFLDPGRGGQLAVRDACS